MRPGVAPARAMAARAEQKQRRRRLARRSQRLPQPRRRAQWRQYREHPRGRGRERAPILPLRAQERRRTRIRWVRLPAARMGFTPTPEIVAVLAAVMVGSPAGSRADRSEDQIKSEGSGSPDPLFLGPGAVDMNYRRGYLKRLSQNHLVAINRLDPTRTKGGRHLHTFSFT